MSVLSSPTTTESEPVPAAERTERRPMRRRVPGTVRAGVWLVAVIGMWLAFGPSQLGGSDDYLFTRGTSMLPTLHAGELVVIRHESAYKVGEIVAYHNEELQAVVVHRIVAIDGSHFVMKGDNNPTADTFHPTISQIVGRDWFVVPGGARLLLNLRVPYIGGPILGLLVIFAFWGDGKDEERAASAATESSQGSDDSDQGS